MAVGGQGTGTEDVIWPGTPEAATAGGPGSGNRGCDLARNTCRTNNPGAGAGKRARSQAHSEAHHSEVAFRRHGREFARGGWRYRLGESSYTPSGSPATPAPKDSPKRSRLAANPRPSQNRRTDPAEKARRARIGRSGLERPAAQERGGSETGERGSRMGQQVRRQGHLGPPGRDGPGRPPGKPGKGRGSPEDLH